MPLCQCIHVSLGHYSIDYPMSCGKERESARKSCKAKTWPSAPWAASSHIHPSRLIEAPLDETRHQSFSWPQFLESRQRSFLYRQYMHCWYLELQPPGGLLHHRWYWYALHMFPADQASCEVGSVRSVQQWLFALGVKRVLELQVPKLFSYDNTEVRGKCLQMSNDCSLLLICVMLVMTVTGKEEDFS